MSSSMSEGVVRQFGEAENRREHVEGKCWQGKVGEAVQRLAGSVLWQVGGAGNERRRIDNVKRARQVQR